MPISASIGPPGVDGLVRAAVRAWAGWACPGAPSKQFLTAGTRPARGGIAGRRTGWPRPARPLPTRPRSSHCYVLL